jgi:hypothetical protein
VAVARDQPAANGVDRGSESVELSLEHPLGKVERLPLARPD